MPRLEGKIVLITGAARGIGQTAAELFVEEGAFVVLSDINDTLGKKETSKLGDHAEYQHLDVSRESDWVRVIEYIQGHFGRLDVLVNNAGITGFFESAGPHDPENLDLDSWHLVHHTNSDGVALGCKYAIKLMKTSKSARETLIYSLQRSPSSLR